MEPLPFYLFFVCWDRRETNELPGTGKIKEKSLQTGVRKPTQGSTPFNVHWPSLIQNVWFGMSLNYLPFVLWPKNKCHFLPFICSRMTVFFYIFTLRIKANCFHFILFFGWSLFSLFNAILWFYLLDLSYFSI